MARDEELGIRLRLKGLEETRRSLAGLQTDMQATEQSSRKATRRGGRGAVGDGGGRGGPSGATIAGGMVAGQAIMHGLQSITTALAQTARTVLDPSLTSTERNVRLAAQAASGLPFVGGLLSAGIEGAFSQKINAERTAAGGIEALLSRSFEAFGQSRPGATVEDFKTQFGGIVNNLLPTFQARAKGLETGRQFLREQFPGLTEDEAADILAKAAEDAARRLAEFAEILGKVIFKMTGLDKAVGSFKDAIINVADDAGFTLPSPISAALRAQRNMRGSNGD
jgi:hypothetical protein